MFDVHEMTEGFAGDHPIIAKSYFFMKLFFNESNKLIFFLEFFIPITLIIKYYTLIALKSNYLNIPAVAALTVTVVKFCLRYQIFNFRLSPLKFTAFASNILT